MPKTSFLSALIVSWAALLLASPAKAEPGPVTQPAPVGATTNIDAVLDAEEGLGRGAGDRAEPTATTEPEPAGSDDGEGTDPRLVVGIALAGVGVLCFATGAVLYSIYLEETKELMSLAEQTNGDVVTGLTQVEFQERYDRAQAFMYGSYGTFGVGAVSTGVGVTYLLLSVLRDDCR